MNKQCLHRFINRHWYANHLTWFSVLLWPVSYIFKKISIRRRRKHTLIADQRRVDIPVVVVGNISVGGVGKTPLVMSLVRHLRETGYTPAIVSRGYGGNSNTYPLDVMEEVDANQSGDEPYMMRKLLMCPVVVSPNRNDAVKYVQTHYPRVNVVISDDGLQHYKMHRDIEIAVVDGVRKFGNAQLLPAGPLRELPSRLEMVDCVVVNDGSLDDFKSYSMTVSPRHYVRIVTDEIFPLKNFQNKRVHAVAGIGHPERFFNTLRALGCTVVKHAFPDHHAFQCEDLNFKEELPIIMTAKDMVKCQDFNMDNLFYLDVDAALTPDFWHCFDQKLKMYHL